MTATNETTTTPETVRLAGWGTFDDLQHAIRARLFGEMVTRAMPLIEHYASDLYHDAHWIDKYVNGETTFYFAPRTWGSHIGECGDTIRSLVVDDHFVCYRVDITCNDTGWHAVGDLRPNGSWFATFTKEVER